MSPMLRSLMLCCFVLPTPVLRITQAAQEDVPGMPHRAFE